MNLLHAIKVFETRLLSLTAAVLCGESKHKIQMIKMLIRLKN